MRLKSTIPVLCNQCIKKEQLISAINIIASNKESALSKYSTNRIFSRKLSGATLLSENSNDMNLQTKIIVSGTPVIETCPLYSSIDGVNSYTPVLNTPFQFIETSKIVFNGTLYVTAVRVKDTDNTRLIYSSDSLTWLDSGMSLADTIQDICSDGFTWTAVAKNTGAMCSSDGKSWNPINLLNNSYFSNCVWAGTQWLISGCHNQQNCIYSSTDNLTWNLLAHIQSQTTFMKYNGKILLIGYRNSPFIQYSFNNGENILNSLSAPFIFPSGCNDVAWNGSLWVAVGPGIHTIATSIDGIIWNGLGNTIFTESGNSVCWNTSHWIAGGSGKNSIAYSINGTDWIGLGSTFTKVTTVCSAFINFR
jgi:hypothetical protein